MMPGIRNLRMQIRVVASVDRNPKLAGFTLIELLVVIAIIAILAAMLIPVLSSAKAKAYTATCINSQKQLMLGWIMYADDNNDQIVSLTIPTTGGNGTAWMTAPTPAVTACANVDQAIGAAHAAWNNGLLVKYAPNPDLQHCPSDQRFKYPVPGPNAQGFLWAYESYSGAGGANADGFSISTTKYNLLTKNGFQRPSDQYVLVEEQDERYGFNENGWDIADPGCPVTGTGHGDWVDTVACATHLDSSTLAFADGHAVKHRWISILNKPAKNMYPFSLPTLADAQHQDLDYMCINMPFNWDAYRTDHPGCQ
jgi:prepilin-type N-terminal cleavage/methylation domain-containing protein